MLVNKLNWTSVPAAPPELLDQLNRQMSDFYATFNQRKDYQNINDDLHAEGHPNNVLAEKIAKYIVNGKFAKVLEVGCGSGKIFGHLLEEGFRGSYKGMEMAEYVIQTNRDRYPQAEWETGSIYDLEKKSELYDCCFAFYVLEHLIYPDRGLAAMLRSVKPGGELILLFPDFVFSGIVPSQKIGISYGLGAKEKLKKGKLIDAVVSYWEAASMRKTLKKINEVYGDFVINYKPYCLDPECKHLIPDFDAVYLGSKQEVEKWAKAQGHEVSYPLGKEGYMARNAYLTIKKKA